MSDSVSAGKASVLLTFLRLLGLMALMIEVVQLGLRTFQCWALSSRLDAIRHLNRCVTITPSCVRALISWGNLDILTEGIPLGRVSSRSDDSKRGVATIQGALCIEVACLKLGVGEDLYRRISARLRGHFFAEIIGGRSLPFHVNSLFGSHFGLS